MNVSLNTLLGYVRRGRAHQADASAAPAHTQDAFDVRWCRGSVAEQVFAPWRARLEAGGARLLGGRRALRVLPGRDGRVSRHDPSKSLDVPAESSGHNLKRKKEVLLQGFECWKPGQRAARAAPSAPVAHARAGPAAVAGREIISGAPCQGGGVGARRRRGKL